MGRKKSLAKLSVAIFIIAGIALVAAHHNNYVPFKPSMVAACESAILENLIAPSTYRRISVTERKIALTFDQYFSARSGESKSVQDFERGMAKEPPVRLIAVLEYDAANSFGVPIRTLSECSYDALNSRDAAPSKHLVKLDGKTNLDRLTDRVKALSSGR